MPTAPKIDPASLIPPFESSLPTALRVSAERELLRVHALTRATYSTLRFLSGSPGNNTVAVDTIQIDSGNQLVCEANSPELLRYSTEHGLELASDADTNRAKGLIAAALLDVIEPYPFLGSSVAELAWRCHIVLAQTDDYDVSFSDPAIPFSIFVSAPARNHRSSILRIAENLIHETMHLQLTLFESLCPLVDTTPTCSIYSPWKQQKRPAQGIMHGLYVFSVLRWMWRQISQAARTSIDQDFALRRIAQIDEEVAALRDFEYSPALTEAGKYFLHQLFVASV